MLQFYKLIKYYYKIDGYTSMHLFYGSILVQSLIYVLSAGKVKSDSYNESMSEYCW